MGSYPSLNRKGGPVMTVWYAIKTLDGRTLSRSTPDILGKWEWICHHVSDDADCAYSSIDSEVAEDGEFITVRGARYAQISREIV